MLNIDKVSDSIRGLITTYMNRFGLAYAGLYRFPNADEIQDWTGFLSVVNITLNREGMRPMHLWLRDGSNILLLLCVNGYFRTHLNDVTDIMQRLWMLRASCYTSPVLIKEWHTDSGNVEAVINGIYQTLGDFSFPRPKYRQRWFGCSMLSG